MAISTVARSGLTTFDKFQRTSTGNLPQTFLATGLAGTVLTSPDGITWTSRSGLPNAQISAPHRNGTLLAVFDSSNNRWTSPDGVTWTKNGQGAMYAGSQAPSMALAQYNANDRTVNIFSTGPAFGANGYTFDVTNATSYGDATVTGASVISTGYATNGSVFLFSGGNFSSTFLWRSATAKGGPYAVQSYGASGNSQSVAFGAGLFVLGDAGGTNLYTSPDGLTWTARGSYGRFVVFLNGLFLSWAGQNLWTSTNGTSWTSRTLTGIGFNSINQIVFGNGLYVLVANAGLIYTSPDGTTWTARTSGTANQLNGVYFG
jgi:hypothetical protein